MNKVKKSIGVLCAIVLFLFAWAKVAEGMDDEDTILYMSQSTYDEIVDTLTAGNGVEPTEHEIVTYYKERYAK